MFYVIPLKLGLHVGKRHACFSGMTKVLTTASEREPTITTGRKCDRTYDRSNDRPFHCRSYTGKISQCV